MKKVLCSLLGILVLSINSQVFAVQNYIYTTTTNESYNATSPVGHFANYGVVPIQNNYNNYSNDVSYIPTASVQDIYVPQGYNRSVITTQQMMDTRESADKIIDRSGKVLGGLAVAGLVTGLVIRMVRR